MIADLSPDMVFRRSLDVRTRKYRGKLFIAAGETVLELDARAEDMFREIDGVSSLREIGARLAGTYGLDTGQAVRDCMEFVAQLAGHGAVEIRRTSRGGDGGGEEGSEDGIAPQGDTAATDDAARR